MKYGEQGATTVGIFNILFKGIAVEICQILDDAFSLPGSDDWHCRLSGEQESIQRGHGVSRKIAPLIIFRWCRLIDDSTVNILSIRWYFLQLVVEWQVLESSGVEK